MEMEMGLLLVLPKIKFEQTKNSVLEIARKKLKTACIKPKLFFFFLINNTYIAPCMMYQIDYRVLSVVSNKKLKKN